MPPTSSKPPPLPLAPDRAAISNKISLLLSSRTSLLKTLNPPSSATTSTTAQSSSRRYNVNADDIEQLFSGARPNEGVGYVPDRKAAAAGEAAAREDRMLRGRLLGKGQRNGKGAAAGGKRFAAESESDEEPGRSGLGKRKRPRREPVEVEETEENEGGDGDAVGEKLEKDGVEDAEMEQVKRDDEDAALVQEQQATVPEQEHNASEDAKRNKKKKKRQREKEKQKQKKLGNAS
ncbi:hypothetical protein V8C42DRAFT_325377 [Trichoderma barbatum]